MTQNTSNYNNEFLISFFLPDGMIGWFEVVNAIEEPNTGITKADVLYSNILNIYLDERDNRQCEQLGLKPNGFTEPTLIKDYPIRNRLRLAPCKTQALSWRSFSIKNSCTTRKYKSP